MSTGNLTNEKQCTKVEGILGKPSWAGTLLYRDSISLSNAMENKEDFQYFRNWMDSLSE